MHFNDRFFIQNNWIKVIFKVAWVSQANCLIQLLYVESHANHLKKYINTWYKCIQIYTNIPHECILDCVSSSHEYFERCDDT